MKYFIILGSSWYYSDWDHPASFRYGLEPDNHAGTLGFRLIKTLK